MLLICDTVTNKMHSIAVCNFMIKTLKLQHVKHIGILVKHVGVLVF
jgi:hypothetical protein